MSDNDVNMPGIDKPAEAVAETAKFGQQVAEIVKAGGQWASAVAGNLPHDVVGILGDTVRAYRYERSILLRERVVKRLRDRGYENAEQLNAPPSLLLPILEAAVDEDRTELQDLWEKLLASASDPNRKDQVRRSFIEILKQLDPQDALVLQAAPQWTLRFQYSEAIVESLKLDRDEVSVSVKRLQDFKLVVGRGIAMRNGDGSESSGFNLSDLARLFLKAVRE